MTDVLIHARLSQIMQALEKMHNGLLAVIDEHNEFKITAFERIQRLEEAAERVCSDCGHKQVGRTRCDTCFGPMQRQTDGLQSE